MKNTIHERVYVLIQSLNLNVNTFAKEIGVNPTVVHNVVRGRMTKPSFDLLGKIKAAFPHVDMNWLIAEEGEMVLGAQSSSVVVEEPPVRYVKKSDKKLTKEVSDLKDVIVKLQKDVKKIKNKLN